MKKLIVLIMIIMFFAAGMAEAGSRGRYGRGYGHGSGYRHGYGGHHQHNAWKSVAILGGTLVAITAIDRAFGGYDRPYYNQSYYQPQPLMNCYGYRTEDVWGIDKYGNRYVQYTHQVRIQIPCP